MKTSMTIRTDSDVKQQAQRIFSALGVDMSTAINAFLRQVIYRNGFPFDIRLDVPNRITLEAIAEGEKMLNQANTKKFANVDELFNDLNAE